MTRIRQHVQVGKAKPSSFLLYVASTLGLSRNPFRRLFKHDTVKYQGCELKYSSLCDHSLLIFLEQTKMNVDLANHLANHRILGPPDAFYIPNFVTQDEEEYLMRKVCFMWSNRTANLMSHAIS
jgi:hypothetical protein